MEKPKNLTNPDSTSYILYLQNLLHQHKIAFDSQLQFTKQKQLSTKQFISGPLETNLKPLLFGQQLMRYSRQMLLKQIGYQGQAKIVGSKVALIGAGGIGCPLGLYLAGAGVGTIGLFDSDTVQITNLHRQIGHSTLSLNQPKTKSLKNSLLRLNPNIKVIQHPFITKQTLDLLDKYDLVIDGSDNPKCRYLVNDYLMSKQKKLLSGACVGWEGQITCYGKDSPCYRCIWGDDQISMGGCSTLGVIGMLPGIVAMILATEALKVIINDKSSLEGQLLTYQARSCTFRKMKLRNKKPQCLACGQNKLIIQDYNYDKYSGCQTSSSQLPQVPNLPWAQAITKMKDNQNYILLDVRPKSQFQIINFKNSINIPYEDLSKMSEQQLQNKINPNYQNIYVSCKVGIASKRGTNYLLTKGYKNVYNIQGGINNYGKLFDPNIPNL